jgi:hypothetical protein
MVLGLRSNVFSQVMIILAICRGDQTGCCEQGRGVPAPCPSNFKINIIAFIGFGINGYHRHGRFISLLACVDTARRWGWH